MSESGRVYIGYFPEKIKTHFKFSCDEKKDDTLPMRLGRQSSSVGR